MAFDRLADILKPISDSEMSSDQACSICLLPYLPDGESAVQLPCRHIFGEVCIKSWCSLVDPMSEEYHDCPNCRIQVLEPDIYSRIMCVRQMSSNLGGILRSLWVALIEDIPILPTCALLMRILLGYMPEPEKTTLMWEIKTITSIVLGVYITVHVAIKVISNIDLATLPSNMVASLTDQEGFPRVFVESSLYLYFLHCLYVTIGIYGLLLLLLGFTVSAYVVINLMEQHWRRDVGVLLLKVYSRTFMILMLSLCIWYLQRQYKAARPAIARLMA